MEQKISFAVAGFFVGPKYEAQKDVGEDELDVDSSDPAFSTFAVVDISKIYSLYTELFRKMGRDEVNWRDSPDAPENAIDQITFGVR